MTANACSRPIYCPASLSRTQTTAWPPQPRPRVRQGCEAYWLTPEQQSCYKVLLLVDGNAWASAWEWALSSGSVIVWVGVWSLHLMTDLLPNVHYLPAKPDLTDLEQQVRWALSHPVEAERIAQNALALFRKVATPEHTRRSLIASLSAAARRTQGGVAGAGAVSCGEAARQCDSQPSASAPSAESLADIESW